MCGNKSRRVDTMIETLSYSAAGRVFVRERQGSRRKCLITKLDYVTRGQARRWVCSVLYVALSV
jgi:hypothetical protein